MSNVEACRSVVEATINNTCKSFYRTVRVAKGEQPQLSDNMQYLLMYVLGVLKSPTVSLPMVVNQVDTIDRIVYQKFLINMMSPDEVLAHFSPQIISISDRNLTDQEFPPLEVLERGSIRSDQVYLMYNSFAIYLYIGRQCDPFFFYELFRATEIGQIDKQMSEDEMFENQD